MVTEILIKDNIELGIWQGIGGAITEATAYNYAKLNLSKKRQLLDAYFSKNGLDYRWGRLSIGGNDFCLKPYEYTKRVDLSDFSIKHDEEWVLPMLGDILRKKNLCLVATPWSPPKCMKFSTLFTSSAEHSAINSSPSPQKACRQRHYIVQAVF